MAKQLDEATKMLIDSLPENIQKLALSAVEIGYMSQMDFKEAIELDEVPDEEKDEVLTFFQQDLGIEIIESDSFSKNIEKYYYGEDEESETSHDKTRDLMNAESEQVDVNSEDDYEYFAKQLERSQTGSLVLGVQDSVQSYLKQIGTVQLLTAAGEVAIAQRIEAASRLVVYGLCESPMTIQAMLDWYQQLLNEEIRLRYIINLEVMYSSDSEKKSLAALSETLKSKGVDAVEDLNEADLEELEDTTESVDPDDEEDSDEYDEDGVKKEDTPRGSSGVPIPVMEEALMPTILELFAKIKRTFTGMQKLQEKRLENLFNSSEPDEALEKKYTKMRLELFESVSKIRLNDDRIAEIQEQLTGRYQLLLGLEGKLLRLAMANKIKREDFLAEYTGNELNRNWGSLLAKSKSNIWANFAKKHEKDILKIQEDIIKIAIETGQPTAEYKKVVELVRRGQAEADRAKREMIEANLRLVIKFAKKSSNRGLGLDFSDLVQDGNIGLMKAVDKFDYRLGNKFSTYATNWIQQGISRSIADQARTIRIPVHMIDNIHKIQRASRQFMHKYGRSPTAEELSKIIYLPVDKINKAMKVNLKPISLESPIGTDNEDTSRVEIIADETAKNPFTSAAQKNLRKIVTQILSELDPKEETVLRQRFGMSTNKTCTLEEVGEYIGVTRERIRQIEQKALNKLKHPTRARKLRSFLED